MTYVSVPEVNMLKNSSTLAVSVPINLYIKLGFVSVNGTRETYFVDTLGTYTECLKKCWVKVIQMVEHCKLNILR